MTDAPNPRFLPSKDLAQLKERVAAVAEGTREPVEAARVAQAHTASLRAENAVLLEMMRFLRTPSHKVNRFP